MNGRSIGKLTRVDQRGIVAEIFIDLGNYINTTDGIRFVGEVGSYVSISEVGRIVVGEITGIDEKPQYANGEMNKPNSNRQVYIGLIGEIIAGKFYFGVSKMPLIFSEVNIISENELRIMLDVSDDEEIVVDGNTRSKLLTIGKSVVFSDYAVKVNIDQFFGFHFSVFGNTGAGKSNTIATIIQSIFLKQNYSAKGAKFVFIDSNGEYAQAFSKIHEVNPDILVKSFAATDEENKDDEKLEIPVWALSADDWAILLHASEKTQVPILKRAIDIAKIFYAQNETGEVSEETISLRNHILASTLMGIFNSSDTSPSKSDKIKNIITLFGTAEISSSTPLPKTNMTLAKAIGIDFGKFVAEESVLKFLQGFIKQDVTDILSRNATVTYNIQQFSEAVQFATLYEGSISSQRIQEYTATLSTRLQAVQESVQGKILTRTNFSSLDEYIAHILGDNQIVNIDVSLLDDAAAEVVTKVMAKLLLDYLKRRQHKADMPINFVIEEAHRFVRNEANYGALGYNIFERIAKEGRKFGLLLGISSQRPSELSKTVVSQCSNFIIHRVQNPDDLQYISRMVPYINQGMIDRLTYLQTGHALVFGTAINLPTLTKFEQANPKPDSDNAKISEKWYIE